MKARIKDTGEIVEVYPDTLAGFLANDGCYYKNEELFTELDDWQSFRREAAKEILAGWYANPESVEIEIPEMARIAIEQADELIKQLKEEKQ